MIQLTRLNRTSVTVNSDLIKLIEQSPDTVITLVNGEKLLVRETIPEILDRIVQFRRSIIASGSLPDLLTDPAPIGPTSPASPPRKAGI
jgi:flagellar protein FlbD